MYKYDLNLENAKKGTTVSVSDIESALRQTMKHTSVSPYTVEIFFKSLQEINERSNGKRVYTQYHDTHSQLNSISLANTATALKVNNFWDDVILSVRDSLFDTPKPTYIVPPPFPKSRHVVVLEQYTQDEEVFYVIRDGVEDLEYSTLSAVENAANHNAWTVVWGSTELAKPDCNLKWIDDIDDPDTLTLTATTANSLTINGSITIGGSHTTIHTSTNLP